MEYKTFAWIFLKVKELYYVNKPLKMCNFTYFHIICIFMLEKVIEDQFTSKIPWIFDNFSIKAGSKYIFDKVITSIKYYSTLEN